MQYNIYYYYVFLILYKNIQTNTKSTAAVAELYEGIMINE